MRVLQCEFTRAREYHIYAHGKRYVDLALCAGRAVWGHRPFATSTKIKNTISQGIWSPLPTRYARQFLRAFSKMFPLYTIVGLGVGLGIESDQGLIENKTTIATTTGLLESQKYYSIDILDPYFTETVHAQKQDTIAVWRPYSGVSFEEFDALVHSNTTVSGSVFLLSPQIPFAWHDPTVFLCKKGDITHTEDAILHMLHTHVNPVVLSGLAYSLSLLTLYGSVQRAPPTHIKNRKDSSIIDCKNTEQEEPQNMFAKAKLFKYKKNQRAIKVPLLDETWKQQGIYISFPISNSEEYKSIRTVFFEHGFYLSTHALFSLSGNTGSTQYARIILPPFFTKHEIKSWEKVIYILQK